MILCFAVSFKFQFHTIQPFDGPAAAIMKTVVMMTSEFEYESLFKGQKSISVAMLRIVFLLFLIFVAIVLMNWIVSVAVNDLQSLTHWRKLIKIRKTGRSFIDDGKKIKRFRNLLKLGIIDTIVPFNPNQPTKSYPNNSCQFKQKLKNSIINKAATLMEIKENKAESKEIQTKLDWIRLTENWTTL